MSPPEIDKLMDALRAGKLTAQQEAQLDEYLAGQPAQRSACEEDLALNSMLRNLPDAPLSSNFTARVLQAARQPRSRSAQPGLFWLRVLLRQWLPNAALAGVVLGAGLIAYEQHHLSERRQLAQGLRQISQLATQTSVELLENFDAIQRLNQAPQDTDRDLIAVLQ